MNWSVFSRDGYGLEHVPCEERLRDQGWFSLGQRQSQKDLRAAPQHVGGEWDRAGRISKQAVLSSSQWGLVGG